MIWWFLLIGAVIMAPETIHHVFIGRPRRKRLERQQERNRLFWSIRDKEMEIYGRWLS